MPIIQFTLHKSPRKRTFLCHFYNENLQIQDCCYFHKQNIFFVWYISRLLSFFSSFVKFIQRDCPYSAVVVVRSREENRFRYLTFGSWDSWERRGTGILTFRNRAWSFSSPLHIYALSSFHSFSCVICNVCEKNLQLRRCESSIWLLFPTVFYPNHKISATMH